MNYYCCAGKNLTKKIGKIKMPTNLLCYRDPNFDINSFDYNFESTAKSIISNDYEFDPVSVMLLIQEIYYQDQFLIYLL